MFRVKKKVVPRKIKITYTNEKVRKLLNESYFNSPKFIETAMIYYEEHLNKSATIYFLKDETTNLIKIGYTKKNLENRINTIKGSFNSVGRSTELKLVKSLAVPPEFAKEAEKELHAYFKYKRKYSEWFAISLKDINDYYKSESIDDDDFLVEYPNDAFDIRDYCVNKLRHIYYDANGVGPLATFTCEEYALICALKEVNKICLWAISTNLEMYIHDVHGKRLVFSWKDVEIPE